jgi:hypothetical protein
VSALRAVASIPRRVHRDYLQPERLAELDRLLRLALDQGYVATTLSSFAELEADSVGEAPARILLLRHDIDSDVARARRIWVVEQQLGITGSWFFRRSTWDVVFMRELAEAGCDVGYHYEELATLIKERGAGSAAEARRLIGPARALLSASIGPLRADSGLPLDVFAAHGDFANRAVGVSNVELLADPGFRAAIGARLEAYDIESRVDARASDGGLPHQYWWPLDPADALRRGERVVELLLHPRAWGAARAENARADLHRLSEGWRYRIRRSRRPR